VKTQAAALEMAVIFFIDSHPNARSGRDRGKRLLNKNRGRERGEREREREHVLSWFQFLDTYVQSFRHII